MSVINQIKAMVVSSIMEIYWNKVGLTSLTLWQKLLSRTAFKFCNFCAGRSLPEIRNERYFEIIMTRKNHLMMSKILNLLPLNSSKSSIALWISKGKID